MSRFGNASSAYVDLYYPSEKIIRRKYQLHVNIEDTSSREERSLRKVCYFIF